MITNLSIGSSGRLGNQIFQYAILKCISFENGYEVILPKENTESITIGRYNPDIKDTDKYKFDLFDCFDLDEKIDNKSNIVKNLQFSYKEDQIMSFNKSLFKEATDNTDYYGFFQCIQYYIKFEKELKKCLKFKENIKENVDKYLKNIKKNNNINNIVTVHVRRGDLASDNGKYNVLLSSEFYMDMINRLGNTKTKFLFISDNIEWCKNNIISDDVLFSDLSYTDIVPQHILDFYILSSGDKIVMSSSSFSWWAAFLSDSKKIYCPNRWFGSEYSNFVEANMRHPKWIQVQYKGLP